MKQVWYARKWVLILLHAAAWMIVFSLPYLLTSHYNDNLHKAPDKDANGFFYLNTLTNFLLVGLFYLNAYVLTPRFIIRKKYLAYIVLLIAIFLGIMGIHGILFHNLIKNYPFIFILSVRFNLPTILLTVAVSIIYQLIGDKIKSDKLATEQQEENLKTELSFLRSQISPHFMFNVLNNIVALARTRSEQLEPTVIKLSSLMRYMLYETKEQKATLKNEIEYLQSYIDLQTQRFEDSVRVNVTIDTPNDQQSIEPMLLIPFVENAFKHGIGLIEDPEIDIKLRTENNMLFFYVRNKYNGSNGEVRDSIAGIGLVNVKRRLNLLYGKDQSLLISEEKNWFTISLQLKLH
ncbi:MAG TPA: histidine kinase [Puia sp.]|jgi:sensor histidine kinase YesM|nr:histidine kinase [Puia sp.]